MYCGLRHSPRVHAHSPLVLTQRPAFLLTQSQTQEDCFPIRVYKVTLNKLNMK